ncbi:MAG: cellulose biosynthesis protein BcsE, partial [Burkholderiaceae bacterium]|nr:cellulose biosynthesis protein BcsE [Burkholderiaceae bacterium]
PEVLLTTLRNMCQMSVHIATVRSEADRWSLDLERWNASTGALFQTAFGLLHEPASGRLTADGTRTRGAQRHLIEAADQSDVLATRAAVEGERGVPSHWRIVDSVADLEAVAATSVAATVLMDAGYASEFEERARLVHHLRQSRPLTLKIVVRENLGKLRTHSEQALLQLGASAVVYQEVGFSRVLQQLQDIKTQSHTRPVNPDYAQALDSFMPARERGYQPPAQFFRLVMDMLKRTHSIGLSHSLVQLTVLAQVPHLDALRACHTVRDGDVFTADHEALYVFLFACREPDVEMALNRLFTLPLTQLFAFEATDCTYAGIQAMATRLQESLRKGLPDYSELLNPAATVGATVYALAPTPQPDRIAVPGQAPLPTLPEATQVSLVHRTVTAPTVEQRPIARRVGPRSPLRP